MLCYIITNVYISRYAKSQVMCALCGYSLGESGILTSASQFGNLGCFGNVNNCSIASSILFLQNS